MRNNQGRDYNETKRFSANAGTCLNTNRETLIITEIAKTESNNCFEKHNETSTRCTEHSLLYFKKNIACV